MTNENHVKFARKYMNMCISVENMKKELEHYKAIVENYQNITGIPPEEIE